MKMSTPSFNLRHFTCTDIGSSCIQQWKNHFD